MKWKEENEQRHGGKNAHASLWDNKKKITQLEQKFLGENNRFDNNFGCQKRPLKKDHVKSFSLNYLCTIIFIKWLILEKGLTINFTFTVISHDNYVANLNGLTQQKFIFTNNICLMYIS